MSKMGLKRKASYSLSPPSSVGALSPIQNQSSPYQPIKPPDNHPYPVTAEYPHVEPSYAEAAMFLEKSPGYFNSRTRKRFRDNRPDDNIIHQNTLNKLYAAQRPSQTSPGDGSPENGDAHASGTDLAAAATSPTSAHVRYSSNISLIAGPVQLQHNPKTKGQRSLDGFFTGTGGRSNSFSKTPHQSASCIPPAPPLRHSSRTSIRGSTEPAMIMTCEDCFSPLLTTTSRNAVDVEMMDVDGPSNECEIDEGWECSRCRKRVCDTCAVRRESRLCLECANPGHGLYDAMEIGEKRWVGGIGWM